MSLATCSVLLQPLAKYGEYVIPRPFVAGAELPPEDAGELLAGAGAADEAGGACDCGAGATGAAAVVVVGAAGAGAAALLE